MAKYWDPPIFSPEIFFTKMTQNSLKWILNTTLKILTFVGRTPQQMLQFFFFFLMKAFLRKVIILKSTALLFSNLRTVEHIWCVLVKDDGLPVDVSSGGQGQAGGKDDDGGPHAGHSDPMDLD